MRVITAPEQFVIEDHEVALFVAGGISNTADWQTEYIKFFEEIPNLVVINPRRDDFDVSDPAQSDVQIKWEHHALSQAHVITFWFSPETLCPITLFELGVQVGYQRSWPGAAVIVGCHPQYQRIVDVTTQLAIDNCTFPVVTSITEVALHAIEAINKVKQTRAYT